MNREEEKEYQEKMGSPEMEYLQYLSEQKDNSEYNCCCHHFENMNLSESSHTAHMIDCEHCDDK